MLSSCLNNQSANKQEPSFYYWKTNFEFGEKDSVLFAQNKVKKLYVRFFDLDSEWGSEIVPIGRLQNKTPFPAHLEIIPVVFIKNHCLTEHAYNRPINTHELARKTWAKISRMHQRHAGSILREIQFDCDWTESTGAIFFQFLKDFRSFSGSVQLSSTVRLYQYKYFEKTGVPPVDKGVLMYYNMSDLKNISTRNYILDHQVGKQYLMPEGHYPLPLDVALPIYRQGVLYDENNKLIRLVQNEEVEEWKSKNKLISISTNTYQLESFYHYGLDSPPNWTLRYETVSTKELKNAAVDLRKHFPEASFVFFDYQDNNLCHYSRSIYHAL